MANLSQEKRQRMLEFLHKIKEEHKDDDSILIALGEIESELTAKKYGLVWEQHEEAVDVMMRDNIPVFTEDMDREITCAAGGVYNFILEGDNLHSLRLLEKTHKGCVDIIYIDPPYNTLKSGFTYNDVMVDMTDGYRHSKWLSFMETRLHIAKHLLSSKGVIFISIDNSELYNLKLLCDSIFGEENFVGNIVWRTTTDNNVTQITTEHEYIICYALNKNNLEKWTSRSPVVDIIQEKYEELRSTYGEDNAKIQLELRLWIKKNQTMLKGFAHYDNVDNKGVFHDGDIANTVQGGYRYEVIHPRTGRPCKIPEKGFRFSEETMRSMLENDDVMFGDDETTLIKPKIRLVDNKSTLRAYYYEDNRSATKSLEMIFNEKSRFSNPKSVNLLKMLFSYAGGKDAVILDFFAGSGSTGEAVLQMNKEDGGKRKFILCTNNEVSALNTIRYLHAKGHMLDYSPGERISHSTIWGKIEKYFTDKAQTFKDLFESEYGKSQHMEYGICRFVTFPRLKTIITGNRDDGSEYSAGIPANLKYYRTDFVSKDEEYLTDALLEHIAEMVQLEHGVKIDGNKYLMILDDDQADEVLAHWEDYPDIRALYVSRNVLFTTEQNALLADTEIHIIPDYYFNFELKEVGETW